MHEWVNWLKCEIILIFKTLQDIQTKNDDVHFYMKILYPCESEFNITATQNIYTCKIPRGEVCGLAYFSWIQKYRKTV